MIYCRMSGKVPAGQYENLFAQQMISSCVSEQSSDVLNKKMLIQCVLNTMSLPGTTQQSPKR